MLYSKIIFITMKGPEDTGQVDPLKDNAWMLDFYHMEEAS